MTLSTSLTTLETSGLIRLAQMEPDLEYLFRHALVQEATYESILKADRRVLHQLVGEGIERLYADRVDELSALLADHYQQAGQHDKAIVFLTIAAERARARYANEEALGFYQQVLLFVSEPTEQIDVRLKVGTVLELVGRWDEAEAHYQDALRLSENIPEATTRCQRRIGVLARGRGDYDAALKWLEQAKMGWETLGNRMELGRVLADVGAIFYRKGDYEEARQVLNESMAFMHEQDDPQTLAFVFSMLGNMAHEAGDYASARTFHQESLALSRKIGNITGITRALGNLGNVVYEEGDRTTARELYAEGLQLSRMMGDKRTIAALLDNLGMVTAEQGDLATARTLHEEGLALRREMGDKRGISMSLHNLGVMLYEQGAYSSAEACLEESLALGRGMNDKLVMASSLNALGVVMSEQGRLEAARPLHEESLALFWEMGNKHGVVINWIGLAAVSGGEAHRLVILLAAAETLRQEIQMELETIDRHRYEGTLTTTRAALGEEAFKTAWAQGEKMTMEEVMVIALERNSPLES